LKKIEGVIRVHTFGLNGKALVVTDSKKMLTEEAVNQALRSAKDLKARKIVRA
jgi:hypothetical protein